MNDDFDARIFYDKKKINEVGLIKLSDENAALKNRRYVLYWA
jgi:hypothetical protein